MRKRERAKGKGERILRPSVRTLWDKALQVEKPNQSRGLKTSKTCLFTEGRRKAAKKHGLAEAKGNCGRQRRVKKGAEKVYAG